MEVTKTLYVKNRKEWHSWLAKHKASKKEVWLIYYKQGSGKPRIPYSDAVEEAICYGWIDSIVKKIDEKRYCQRYTPRSPKSIWSDTNVKRLKKMLDADKMTQTGLDRVPTEVMDAAISGKIYRKGPVIPKVLEIPDDLATALAKNHMGRKNWERFAPSHRKMYIYWITDSKKQETRERRIARVVEYARNNRKLMM